MKEPKKLYQEKYEKALMIVNAYKRLHYDGSMDEIMGSHKSKYEKLIKMDELRKQTIQDAVLLEKAEIYF